MMLGKRKSPGQEEIDERIRAAGERAKAEAERRRQSAAPVLPLPREIDGPKGREPTRYGDWERNGLISDF